MIEERVLSVLSDPMFEALARCSRPQYGYGFVEPVAVVVQKAGGIRVVVRLRRERPHDNLRSTNRFAVLNEQGQWSRTEPFVGLSDVAYHLRHTGWGDATLTPADDNMLRTVKRLEKMLKN